jgi:hypothetical protein
MTGMRVLNDPGGDPGGALSELLRLQGQFQARLAEETISYLRRLQGAAAPNAPGTVLLPEAGTVVEGSGTRGGAVKIALEVENRQRVHCMVTPLLGPLVDAAGVTWNPAARAAPPSQLVGPGEVARLELTVDLPQELPAGMYRGALLLQGFRDGGVPVAIAAAEAASAPAKPGAPASRRAPDKRAPAKRAPAKRASAKRASAKRAPASGAKRGTRSPTAGGEVTG